MSFFVEKYRRDSNASQRLISEIETLPKGAKWTFQLAKSSETGRNYAVRQAATLQHESVSEGGARLFYGQ
jgi:hypothetical protein